MNNNLQNTLYNLWFELDQNQKIINKLNFSWYKINNYFTSQIEDWKNKIENKEDILKEIDNFLSFYFDGWDFGYFKNKYDNYSYRLEYSWEDTSFIWSSKDSFYIKTSDENNNFKPDLWSLFWEDTEFIFEKKFDEDKPKNHIEIIKKDEEIQENEETIKQIFFVNIYNQSLKNNNKNTKEEETKKYLLANIEKKLNEYFDDKNKQIGTEFIKQFSKNWELEDFFTKWKKDYFIHKNIKQFLENELLNYLWDKYWNANIAWYNDTLKQIEKEKFDEFYEFLNDEENKINQENKEKLFDEIDNFLQAKLYKKDDILEKIKKLVNKDWNTAIKDILQENKILNNIITKQKESFDDLQKTTSNEFWEKFRKYTKTLIDIIAQIEEIKKSIWTQKRNVEKSDYVVSLKTLKENLSYKEFDRVLKIFKFTIENNDDFKNDIINVLKDKYRNVDMVSSVIVDNILYYEGIFKFNFLRKKEYSNKVKIIDDKLFSVNKNWKEKELWKIINIQEWNKRINKDDLNLLESKKDRVDIYFELSENDYTKENKMWNNLYINYLDIEKDFSNFYIDTQFINDFADKYFIIDKIIKIWIDWHIIKSENYQALNTIEEKFKNLIDLIWIDPPFNTDNNQFLYKDSFLDSSWCSMIDDRLNISNHILRDTGSFYMHLDENADYISRYLLNKYFIFRNEIIWKHFWWRMNDKKKIYEAIHDTIMFYTKSNDYIFNYVLLDWEWEEKYKYITTVYDNYITTKYSQFNYKEWAFWYKVWETTQKTEDYLQKYIRVSSNKNSIVMDYFAGTGTTLATAHKLWRKWIGINISEVFNDIFINRMKKVLIGDMWWISKEEDVNWQGWWAFKYIELENYENIFDNTAIENYITRYFEENQNQVDKKDYTNFAEYIENYKYNTLETKDFLQSIIYDFWLIEKSYKTFDDFVILKTNKWNFVKFFENADITKLLKYIQDDEKYYLQQSDYKNLIWKIDNKKENIFSISKLYFNN